MIAALRYLDVISAYSISIAVFLETKIFGFMTSLILRRDFNSPKVPSPSWIKVEVVEGHPGVSICGPKLPGKTTQFQRTPLLCGRPRPPGISLLAGPWVQCYKDLSTGEPLFSGSAWQGD